MKCNTNNTMKSVAILVVDSIFIYMYKSCLTSARPRELPFWKFLKDSNIELLFQWMTFVLASVCTWGFCTILNIPYLKAPNGYKTLVIFCHCFATKISGWLYKLCYDYHQMGCTGWHVSVIWTEKDIPFRSLHNTKCCVDCSQHTVIFPSYNVCNVTIISWLWT